MVSSIIFTSFNNPAFSCLSVWVLTLISTTNGSNLSGQSTVSGFPGYLTGDYQFFYKWPAFSWNLPLPAFHQHAFWPALQLWFSCQFLYWILYFPSANLPGRHASMLTAQISLPVNQNVNKNKMLKRTGNKQWLYSSYIRVYAFIPKFNWWIKNLPCTKEIKRSSYWYLSGTKILLN